MLALVVGLPILIVMDTKENGSRIQCNEYGWPNANLRGAYTAVSFCLTYAIPLPLIAVFYSIIVFKLHQMSKETSNKEGFRTARAKGRVVKMLMVVVTCYALCFLPYHVVFMWFEFGDARMYRCGSFISYIYCASTFADSGWKHVNALEVQMKPFISFMNMCTEFTWSNDNKQERYHCSWVERVTNQSNSILIIIIIVITLYFSEGVTKKVTTVLLFFFYPALKIETIK